jgi:hypothetical protein
VSKDFKTLQYFSSVNQFIATGNSNQNNFKRGSTWMAYWPCHETECCAGNVHRFMPNYAARMWMQDKAGGIVAALYGPSVGEMDVDDGRTHVSITETTNYPFSDKIDFTFDITKPTAFPFSFRIPAWCTSPVVSINGKKYTGNLLPGTFIIIKQVFKKGDVISVKLPMAARLVQCGTDGVAVERGPLLFAFPIAEKVTIDTATYANLNGKKSLNPAFPALDIQPAGPWNYTLAVTGRDFSTKVQVVESSKDGYPFDPSAVPVVIRIPAKLIKNWQLDNNRYTPPRPRAEFFETTGKEVMITLVPYGSTRLRLSVFPTAQ